MWNFVVLEIKKIIITITIIGFGFACIIPTSALTNSQYNSQFISATVPSQVTAGSTIALSVKFKNLGTKAWTNTTNFRAANLLFANIGGQAGRLDLDPAQTILQNQTGEFKLILTVPQIAGVYNMQFQVIEEYYAFIGEISPVFDLNVVANNFPITNNTIDHILVAGQSLAAGYNSFPIVSTNNKAGSYTLSGFNQDESSIISSVETGKPFPNGETIVTGIASNINFMSPNKNTLVTNHGVSGFDYDKLKFGTGPFSKAMKQVESAKNASILNGLSHNVKSISLLHGESDQLFGYALQYKNNLNQWLLDYNREIKNITGQTNNVKMFIDQFSAFNQVWTQPSGSEGNVTLQQLDAFEHNPNNIILIGPKYFLDYSDAIHLTGPSTKLLSAYHAKAYKKSILDNQNYAPLMPISITRSDNIITLKTNSPSNSQITVDTNSVAYRNNFGFRYTENTPSPANITNVQIMPNNEIKISLDKIPSGTSEKLRYAMDFLQKDGGGRLNQNSPAGNIRDQDTMLSEDGDTLPNWLVHFEKPVIDNSKPKARFRVNLSGNFDIQNGIMNTTLRQKNIIPQLQPYNISPFNYNGSEYFGALPNNAVDWVLVDFVDPNFGFLIDRKALLLLDNGYMIDQNGESAITLNNLLLNQLFQYKIIIRHRNHLPISSKNLHSFTNSVTTDLDFTSNLDTLSDNQAQVGNGVFGLRLGNTNSDNSIDSFDRNILRQSSESNDIYTNYDINLDGEVDAIDRNILSQQQESEAVLN
jgi:hypothetical protein